MELAVDLLVTVLAVHRPAQVALLMAFVGPRRAETGLVAIWSRVPGRFVVVSGAGGRC